MSSDRESPFSSAPPARIPQQASAAVSESERGGASSSTHGDRSCALPGGGEGASVAPSIAPSIAPGMAPSIAPGPEGERISTMPGLEPQRVTMPAMAPTYSVPASRGGSTVLTSSDSPTIVTFGSGRAVALVERGGDERIEIRSASGALLVAMRLTDEGPVFSLSGASFEISAAKSMTLSAETLHVSATKDITIDAGGTLVQRAAGDAIREVGGLDRVSARDVQVAAHPGGISLRANDDVDVVGERVRLNSDDPPMPLTWEEHRGRHALPIEGGARQTLASGPGASPATNVDQVSKASVGLAANDEPFMSESSVSLATSAEPVVSESSVSLATSAEHIVSDSSSSSSMSGGYFGSERSGLTSDERRMNEEGAGWDTTDDRNGG